MAEMVRGDLQTVLDWMVRTPDGRTPAFQDRCPYAPYKHWERSSIQRDLWARACETARRGLITVLEQRLWGHWYGISDSHHWAQAEIRRRLGVGRAYADRRIKKVTTQVAQTLVCVPPGDAAPIELDDLRPSDLQEAGATVIGRAIVEQRRHRDETHLAIHDLLRTVKIVPAQGATSLARNVGQRKRNLKTTRHAHGFLSEWHRAALDAAERRLQQLAGPASPYLPLWKPTEPASVDLEQAYQRLHSLHNSRERRALAETMRDGHHHLMHTTADRDLVLEFLFLEVAILRDSYNITSLPILNILESIVSVRDHRRAIIARERAHILEVHHLWSAAESWLAHADARLRDPRVNWPDADAKYLNAVNIMVRLLNLRFDQAMAHGELPHMGMASLQARISALLGRIEQSPASLGEWRHLAERHGIQLRLAISNAERRHGVGAAWEDSELLHMEDIDKDVAELHAPARILAWETRKLSVLLEADLPSDFLRILRQSIPYFELYGPAWPNQIAALRVVVESALRRRGSKWVRLREEFDHLRQELPRDTDEMLRHPMAIPKPLIVRGTPVF
jgi:hypothetical protein